MSQLGITCKEQWEVKDLPQNDNFNNAHEGQFEIFIKSSERLTSKGCNEWHAQLSNVLLLCFVHISMLRATRKALQDSVGMDKFHQMSNLLLPFVGLQVGCHMISWLLTVLVTPTQFTVSGMWWMPSTDTPTLQFSNQTIMTNRDQLPRALLRSLLQASSAVLGL